MGIGINGIWMFGIWISFTGHDGWDGWMEWTDIRNEVLGTMAGRKRSNSTITTGILGMTGHSFFLYSPISLFIIPLPTRVGIQLTTYDHGGDGDGDDDETLEGLTNLTVSSLLYFLCLIHFPFSLFGKNSPGLVGEQHPSLRFHTCRFLIPIPFPLPFLGVTSHQDLVLHGVCWSYTK
jgi:hypothetical protein